VSSNQTFHYLDDCSALYQTPSSEQTVYDRLIGIAATYRTNNYWKKNWQCQSAMYFMSSSELQVQNRGTAFQLICDKLTLAFNDLNSYKKTYTHFQCHGRPYTSY